MEHEDKTDGSRQATESTIQVTRGPGEPTVVGSIPETVSTVLGSGAAIGAAVKCAADVAKTALTERGETRREQLRQDGETERARIAKAAAAPESEVAAEQAETPENDARYTPG
ncbi:hypothetical protein GCM10010441_39620 [Kitasatospora paracochleata]|uniref:Uncharacterized protein n=1 Tax=Kitasatospora paracochleata TaxID=58354 RepID=A0ABT1IW08_9ACTN|nr:hypothetical protein [Kitasatospora paracochleata]MCP2309318.1 hypothetical protein [Kitasatospora paracochleata]